MLCQFLDKFHSHDHQRSEESILIGWWKTKFGEEEIERIANSIRGGNVSQGEVTREFEKKLEDYFGVKHVVATSSGSAALTLALMAIGVSPGDEVIVPNRSWIATAHAVTVLGGKVILADVEKTRPLLAGDRLEELISAKTKAIIPVHLNGRAADLKNIQDIARSNQIPVIEDAAQAIGSQYQNVLLGTFGTVGCFSFSVAKTLATGQGGVAITEDNDIAGLLRAMRTHGVENVKNPEKWQMPGSNFRFTDIAASIGLVQLTKLEKRLERARSVYRKYREGVADLSAIQEIPIFLDDGEVPVYNEFLFEDRDNLIKFLHANQIDTRPSYPDLDRADYLNQDQRKFPNSRIFAAKGLVLPSGPDQSDEDVDRVIEMLATRYS